MGDTKELADDYYINGLTNSEIFEKHGLKRSVEYIGQERVFQHLPHYQHQVRCEHCGGSMESNYMSKSARLANEQSLPQVRSSSSELLELNRVEANHSKSYEWSRTGNALLVEEGYRVSTPECIECGHKLDSACQCGACLSLMKEKADQACEITYRELLEIESIDADSLNCKQLLSIFVRLSEILSNSKRIESIGLADQLNFGENLNLMLLGCMTINQDSILPAIEMVSRSEYVVDWDSIRFRLVGGKGINKTLLELKLLAINFGSSDTGSLDLIEVWESLAMDEALSVLEHYCHVHDIHCNPGDQTVDAIKRSLNRYGLAQTARYIYNAVWRARKYASENGHNNYRAFTFIYGNLNFWIEDERARGYSATPFKRTEELLCEPREVAVFSKYFLDQNSVSYFTDPISINVVLRNQAGQR